MPSSEVMSKWKAGKLHSGSKSGPKVKSQQQAVAIKLSEQRNENAHGGTYVDSDGEPQQTVRGRKPVRTRR